MAEWIFLDNHTKTRPSKSIADQLAKDARVHWIMGPVEKAKEEILEFFGASGNALHLTGSNAEANFQVLFSHYVDQIRETGRTHILSIEGEKPSILGAIKRLEKFEVKGKILPVNESGHLTKAALQEAIRARSSLLSISYAHPLTGVVQPIHDLIEICRENEVKVHVDVSSALGKLFIPFEGIDYLTFDGQLIRFPGQAGGIIVRKGEPFTPARFGDDAYPYAHFAALQSALTMAQDKLDHYAMEVGRLRAFLENKLEQLGGKVLYQNAERLPNTTAVSFAGIHGEVLIEALKKQGIFAAAGQGLPPSAISFVLSDETTAEEVERVGKILDSLLEKLRKSPRLFTKEEAKAKGMRLCSSQIGEKETIELSLLVDEEDGVIADARSAVFGPPALVRGATVTCDLLIRKNYMQARRLSADLIEKQAGPNVDAYVNQLLEVVDKATEGCMDIPIEDVYVAPPSMEGGERQEYPGWQELDDAQRKAVIAQVMETEIQPYVELDAGGVEVVKVEDNRVTIAYSGNCTSCFSATGATLDAIGNILRHKIYPDLMVIPDLSLLTGQ